MPNEIITKIAEQRQKELKENDNFCTRDSIFVVYQTKAIYSPSNDYTLTTSNNNNVKDELVIIVDNEEYTSLHEVIDVFCDETEEKAKQFKNENCNDLENYGLIELTELIDEINNDSYIFQVFAKGYIDSFVTVCFTMEAAKQYIENQKHNLKNPFVYVESACHNPQIRELLKLFGDKI